MPSDVSPVLRNQIARRAQYRCEYCLIHADEAGFAHQVDHIVSRKHGGLSVAGNLAYACLFCNRHKGSDIASIDPENGRTVRLFNPRREHWTDHFRFDGSRIEPLSETGRATERLLRFNAAERIAERMQIP